MNTFIITSKKLILIFFKFLLSSEQNLIQRVTAILKNYRNTMATICILGVSISTASASIIEIGNTNLIQDLLNPSDGLYFLDTTGSDGLTMAEAINNATSLYLDARFATPAEWDNLFMAAGISYTGSLTASAAFDTGGNTRITSSDSNVGLLNQILSGSSNGLWIWSDPDGSSAGTSTREFILLGSSFADIRQDSRVPGGLDWSWLIVSDSGIENANVPAPATIWLLSFGLIGVFWNKKKVVKISSKYT